MKESEFCPKCELWNKRNPSLPQRETYYDTVLCPNCWDKPTRPIDEVIEEVLEKYAEHSAKLLNHKRPEEL